MLAILAFIVFESMLFAGLLGGFSLLRFGSAVWPPPGQPYLPIALTWVNTVVLLGSVVPLTLAGRALRRGDDRRFSTLLVLTAALGALFLAIQGTEWVRLLAHGLKVVDGVYGGMFLMLIGTHGLHVLGAVVWLGVLAVLAARGRLRAPRPTLQIAATYWWFVCAVWVALFGLVYLA
jgi:cytochrome c oxidase subunit 3